ncbi:zinc-binding dehydrogenase [Lentilactobacillus kosonis]|uniref:NADPH:quinone reductase related Zn-dependent oxidoreductase n=1 Tax=Lentilactobacillus kosonis TaxID=2810561 RepID=A0A401FJ54_9LACO|nr:NADPH:quinone reductase related Zn-dependent oxidoreductase [Lentilactobacillus kosonis]
MAAKITVPELTSIALMNYEGSIPFQFVHEEFSHEIYQQLIQKLTNQQLIAPIDRIFPVTQIKEAQHYTQDNHSRGRVLVSFN